MISAKALIVDDLRFAREFKAKTLEFATDWAPEDILQAATLGEAIVLANQHELSLVSLDLFLKDSSGVDTLKRFIAETRVLPGKIYVITADAHDVALREACEALLVAAVIPPGLEPWGAPGRFTNRQKDEIRDIVSEVLTVRFIERDKLFTEELEKMAIRIVEGQQRVLDERRIAIVYKSVTVAVMGIAAWFMTTLAGPYLAQVLRDGISHSIGNKL